MHKPFVLAMLVATSLASFAHGQASLSFSGGNGTPFSFTLAEPIVFTVTREMSAGWGEFNGPWFLFQNVGNVFGHHVPGSGTITFTINGGAAQAATFHGAYSGFTGGAAGVNDMYISGAHPGVAVGDVIQLSAGTFTTDWNVAAAPPPAGLYPVFVMDGSGNMTSTFGAPVPEPQSIALLATSGLGLLGLLRKRRSAQRGASPH